MEEEGSCGMLLLWPERILEYLKIKRGLLTHYDKSGEALVALRLLIKEFKRFLFSDFLRVGICSCNSRVHIVFFLYLILIFNNIIHFLNIYIYIITLEDKHAYIQGSVHVDSINFSNCSWRFI